MDEFSSKASEIKLMENVLVSCFHENYNKVNLGEFGVGIFYLRDSKGIRCVNMLEEKVRRTKLHN